jgi:glycosyltransferase involved in cell wall biosynthesis
MMVEHLGDEDAAKRMESAVRGAIRAGECTRDLGGSLSTREAADAVIAVSQGMRSDILGSYPGIPPERVHVIYNGIDANVYRPEWSEETLRRHGVDPAVPYAIFVGRVTRQKGLSHLLEAALQLDPSHQLVICAGAADTPELATEVDATFGLTKDPFLFMIEATVRPGVTHAAVEAALLRELGHLADEPILETEFARVRRGLLASVAFPSDTITWRAFRLGSLLSTGAAPSWQNSRPSH